MCPVNRLGIRCEDWSTWHLSCPWIEWAGGGRGAGDSLRVTLGIKAPEPEEKGPGPTG